MNITFDSVLDCFGYLSFSAVCLGQVTAYITVSLNIEDTTLQPKYLFSTILVWYSQQ